MEIKSYLKKYRQKWCLKRFSVVQKLFSELSVSTRVLVDWSKESWNQYKASVRRREESDEMHILPLLSGLYPL